MISLMVTVRVMGVEQVGLVIYRLTVSAAGKGSGISIGPNRLKITSQGFKKEKL